MAWHKRHSGFCLEGSLAVDDKENNKSNLQKQNTGHANDKAGMLCFMPEDLHAKDGSNASSQNRREKQRFLRDAPQVFPGFVFVQSHEEESACIYKKQIAEQYRSSFHKNPPIFLLRIE